MNASLRGNPGGPDARLNPNQKAPLWCSLLLLGWGLQGWSAPRRPKHPPW